MLKICRICGIAKSFDAFYTTRIGNPAGNCKQCHIAQTKAWRESHPDKFHASQRKWRLANPAKQLAAIAAWQKKNPQRFRAMRRALDKKRRARQLNAPVIETVTLAIIYIRDSGLCSLCGRSVTRREASIDHIIPLSQGGEHSYRNCALAHRRCNSSKKDRVKAQQMRLF